MQPHGQLVGESELIRVGTGVGGADNHSQAPAGGGPREHATEVVNAVLPAPSATVTEWRTTRSDSMTGPSGWPTNQIDAYQVGWTLREHRPFYP